MFDNCKKSLQIEENNKFAYRRKFTRLIEKEIYFSIYVTFLSFLLKEAVLITFSLFLRYTY